MAYHIYTSAAWVLSQKPLREADREYLLLTRELGLLRASATGVRRSTSKLRGALEPYSIVEVSLVKGRERWRLTSASLGRSLASELDKPHLQAFARVANLLERLIAGEEKHPAVYDIVFRAATEALGVPDTDTELIEIYMVALILPELGYLPKPDFAEAAVAPALERVRGEKRALVSAINKGLQSSHLV